MDIIPTNPSPARSKRSDISPIRIALGLGLRDARLASGMTLHQAGAASCPGSLFPAQRQWSAEAGRDGWTVEGWAYRCRSMGADPLLIVEAVAASLGVDLVTVAAEMCRRSNSPRSIDTLAPIALAYLRAHRATVATVATVAP